MNRAIRDTLGTLPLLYQLVCMHARIQKVLSEGVKFFFYLEGKDDPSKYHYKRAIIGPPAICHLNGVSLTCR